MNSIIIDREKPKINTFHVLQSYRLRKLGLHSVYTRTIFDPNNRVAKLLKVNKQQMPQVFLLRAFCSFWGSWRIRTAVHGFADRWLSHSSKEPIFLICGCKGSTFFGNSNYPQQFFFFSFFVALHSAHFSSINRFKSQPVTQFAHGLPFSFVRRKNA